MTTIVTSNTIDYDKNKSFFYYYYDKNKSFIVTSNTIDYDNITYYDNHCNI
jgi:hypothetical protein